MVNPLIRMFAVMVVMAQMGSFVAANRASLPIYDGIFTRIGSVMIFQVVSQPLWLKWLSQ